MTEAIRRNPYSIILLDEVEKAHPDVFNILLQVLDDGRLTDSQGRTVNFKNCVVIMTSNLGSERIREMAGAESGELKKAIEGELRAAFRPEFLNRIDEVVVFESLGKEQIAAIVSLQLEILKTRLQEKEIELKVSNAALLKLAEWGWNPEFGARPVQRMIQQKIANPLASLLLSGKVPEACIEIDVKDSDLVFHGS